MAGKSTKKGKTEGASKPEETSADAKSPEPTETPETKPAEPGAPTIEQRLERLEQLLTGGEAVEAELVDGQLAVVTVDELESRFLTPLLERIERLEEHGHLGAPPELPEAIEVRVRGKRRRLACAGQVLTRDWRVIHPETTSQLERLHAEHEAGTIEVRRARR